MFWKALLVLLSLVFMGCSSNVGEKYHRSRATCKNKCSMKQANNVGSTFMFRDLHATFGKCKCYDGEGKVIEFFIPVEKGR